MVVTFTLTLCLFFGSYLTFGADAC